MPRYLRREQPGRMNYRGAEKRPLDLAPLAVVVEEFRADGVQGAKLDQPAGATFS